MTSLIGETIESQPRFPIWAVLWGIVALAGGGVLAVTNPPHSVALMLVPMGMATGAWIAREKLWRFTVEADRLSFEQPSAFDIHYADMIAVGQDRGGNDDSFPVLIYRSKDCIRLPRKLNVSSRDLCEFLHPQLPPQNATEPPRELEGFYREQVEKFGEDKVHLYRATTLPDPPPPPSAQRGIWLGFAAGSLLGGIALGVIAGKGDYLGGGIFGGIFFALIGALIAYAVRTERRNRSGKYQDTALIISPFGIALVQEDMKGKLRWDEILAVEHPPIHRAMQASTAKSKQGIGIKVAGAYIVIKDRFDESPARIARLMRQHLRG
ncbi:hypothetical protein BH11PLA2_BH11PLA2_07220 [soil metagenome]